MPSTYAERFIRFALSLLFAALLLQLLITLPPGRPGPTGLSLRTQRPVAQMVAQSLPVTLKTVAAAAGLGLPLALLLGIPAGLRPGRLPDRALQGPAIALSGVPAFSMGLLGFLLLVVNGRLLSIPGAAQAMAALLFGLWMARAVRNGVAAARVDGARLPRGRTVLGAAGRILQQTGNLVMVAALVGQIAGGQSSGLWGLVVSGAMQRDYPVVYGALWALVAIILTGHLVGDLLVAAGERRQPAAGGSELSAPGARLSRSWLILGLALFALLLLTSFTGWGESMALNLQGRLRPPGPGHLLGTDQYGRDLLNRIGTGARTSLTIAAMATFLAAVGGAVFAGLGRATGRWGMALLSPRIAVPSLFAPLAASLVATLILSPSVVVLMLTLGLTSIPAAARAWRQLFEPLGGAGVTGKALTATAGLMLLTLAQILLTEVTLSYLGMGVQPPTASLGNLIYEHVNYLRVAPHLSWIMLPSSLGLAGLFLAGHALAGEES